MGFSALAESLLNFGLFGPAVLGFAWGSLTKFFDSHRRGIMFYIFAFMTIRLFRSDFASLYKSYIIVFGGSVLIVLLILYCLAAIAEKKAIGTNKVNDEEA